jgi:creatinine amidohydrolase/Fe(II)-dependent formamide hydrolase-like protein
LATTFVLIKQNAFDHGRATETNNMSDVTTSEASVEKKKAKEPSKLISLEDLCKELKIDGIKARRLLRASGIKHKHGTSWEWERNSAGLKEARAILTK